MKFTQVRNATMLVEFNGHRLLIDPMLGSKGSLPALPSPNPARNPLVDLTLPLQDLLNVDAVAVSHTHFDHWDPAAAALLPRSTPILTQHAQDQSIIAEHGFTDVRVLDAPITVGGATFTKTHGQHGTDAVIAAWGEMLGEVMGFVLASPGEPTVYFAGDTVLNDDVLTAIDTHKPDVIVLNTGEVRFPEGPALMGAEDVLAIHRAAPDARVIAVHMEALNHCTVTRADVRALAKRNEIESHVIVPEDGEVFTL